MANAILVFFHLIFLFSLHKTTSFAQGFMSSDVSALFTFTKLYLFLSNAQFHNIHLE